MNLQQQLSHGLAQLDLKLPAAAEARLIAYLELIEKWNKVYNLTAVRDAHDLLTRHLLDCLAIVPRITAANLLDVGSGAGLPGIPVAIALPRLPVTLLDSSHKRAAFLKQAAIELRLHNVTVVCERVEQWETPQRFELVVSRALTDLPEFIRLAGRLIAPGGSLAAMKGVYPHEELALLPERWRVSEAAVLEVPGLRGERHWVSVQPAGASS